MPHEEESVVLVCVELELEGHRSLSSGVQYTLTKAWAMSGSVRSLLSSTPSRREDGRWGCVVSFPPVSMAGFILTWIQNPTETVKGQEGTHKLEDGDR